MKMYQLFIRLLMIILVFYIIANIFIAVINPETFLFSKKLSGEKAIIYLLSNALIGIILLALLLTKNYQNGIFLSILYFGYNIIEKYITYQTLSPFAILSLIVSVLALIYFKLEM